MNPKAEHEARMPMHIEYQISEHDYVNAASLATLRRSKWSVGTLTVLPSLGAIMVTFSMLFAWFGRSEILVPTFIVGSMLLLLPLLSRFRMRRDYRETLALQDRQGLDIENDTLRFWSAIAETETTWRDYSYFAEDSNSFVLFRRDKMNFIAIPKGGLAAADIADLREVFSANLRDKPLSRQLHVLQLLSRQR